MATNKTTEVTTRATTGSLISETEPTSATSVLKNLDAVAAGPAVDRKKVRKARVMRDVIPGKRLPRVVNGEFVGKALQSSRPIDLPVQSSSLAGDNINVPASNDSNHTLNISAPESVSASINASPGTLTVKPLKEVLCCGQAVHKNNGMYMDKHQEIMHKIIFERSGKLPDGVINTKNSEVPWGDVDIIMGMATIHTNGNRLARLFAYYFKPKLHPRQLVEITGTQPPMVSWADKEDLEKECLIRARGTNVTYACPIHTDTTHFLYHVTYWRGNKLQGF